MPRGQNKCGLRVSYCEDVGSYRKGGRAAAFDKFVSQGWFVQVRLASKWYCLIDMPFMRQQDALRAAQALTAAGLDTAKALRNADPLTVRQIACEHLQW